MTLVFTTLPSLLLPFYFFRRVFIGVDLPWAHICTFYKPEFSHFLTQQKTNNY